LSEREAVTLSPVLACNVEAKKTEKKKTKR
jgi:hypothetical protein